MISTASLPDIVFMLLFFFLTVTTLRQSEELVRVRLPEASEVAKIDRKDLTCYIYVGTPVPSHQTRYGTDSRIQLNDSFREISEIRDFIANERERRSESDRQFMSTTLKVDSDVRMGIITDIKQELRRCSALKLNYSARKGKQH
ncbi:MAG: biopolymer transporter ExbD [Prevotellaceae bacterium]|nr:biopolymer transporter ExbD [Prevotellaceae bacterium]